MRNISIIPQLKVKRPTDQEGSIIIRAFYNSKPVKAKSLGYRILIKDWDYSSRRAREQAPNASLINSLINRELQSIQEQILKKELSQIPIDADGLASIISGNADHSFIEYAEKMIMERRLADGAKYADGTIRRYDSEILKLKEFQQDLKFHQLNEVTLHRYKTWLQNRPGRKLHKNSIWKSMSFIRTVWNDAIKNKAISPAENPFRSFKVGKWQQCPEKIKFLTLADIDLIEEVLVSKADLLPTITLQVGWRFLFMCVSGLRISDARLLNENFLLDINVIGYTPHKTRRHNNKAKIHLVSDRQIRYLNKTLELSYPKKEPEHGRKIFNEELKTIALLAGINMHITSHVGRHTMGSFIVDGSIDQNVAREILGVKSDEVIKGYLHLKETKLLEETQKLKSVF